MSRHRLFIILFAALIVAGIVGYWVSNKPSKPSGPLEISFWYWHSPFQLDKSELAALERLNVKRIFIRASTISNDGKRYVGAIPQTFASKAGQLKVQLVYPFDSGAVKHFEQFKISDMARDVASVLERDYLRVTKAGLNVEGFQLDMDCPTRLLSRYREFVQELKKTSKYLHGPDRKQISITGLTSWLGERSFADLCKELDFVAPQFYEAITGMRLDQFRPVGDIERLKRGIPKAENLPCPYWVGVPAYGHALAYNERGQLSSIFRSASPAELLRYPEVEHLESYPSDRLGKKAKGETDFSGEQIALFKIVRTPRSGTGLGYTLAFSLPTPDLVRTHIETLESLRGANCQGAILYRFPEPDATMTLSMPGIEAALAGKKTTSDIVIEAVVRRDTYDMVDSPELVDPSYEITLRITNKGLAATTIGRDALTCTLNWENAELDDVRPGGSDTVFPGIAGKNSFVPTSLARATAVQFQKGFVHPGETLTVGPIRLIAKPGASYKISWNFLSSEGFERQTRELPKQELTRSVSKP